MGQIITCPRRTSTTTLGGAGEVSGGKRSPKALQLLPECLNFLGFPREEAVLAGPRDRQLDVNAAELVRKNKPVDFG